MIVLDTHALLWWALDPAQLSPTATNTMAQAETRGGYASSISIWELAVKVQSGKLKMGVPIDELARLIERNTAIELVAVDLSLWLSSLALPWEHRDPADRIIVATALSRGLPLLTKDELIRGANLVPTIW